MVEIPSYDYGCNDYTRIFEQVLWRGYMIDASFFVSIEDIHGDLDGDDIMGSLTDQWNDFGISKNGDIHGYPHFVIRL